MTENKRFVDDGFEAIEEQSFTDNLTKKTYYVDYFDEIIGLCNSLWKQTKRFEKHNKNLNDENEQLKQRNKRQYNQLTELWGLIKNKDWETLTKMVKQMEEDEERLQKEWKCYE